VRNFASHLRSPLRVAVDALDDDSAARLVATLARLHAHIGLAAIDIGFARLGPRLMETADDLLRDPATSTQVKARIVRHKEQLDRPLGSSRWEWLADALAAPA
jgi:hypothetical protein